MSDYPNLEPHHTLKLNEDGSTLITCPFINPVTVSGYETLWAASASTEEVNCLFCEYLNGELQLAGPPIHDAEDNPNHGSIPPIIGASHGAVHSVNEYAPCQIPLRRIAIFDVSVVVHEGAAASLLCISARYFSLNGPVRYPVRQRDTGAYVCRKTVSGASWSKRAYGCAIDINWQTNPYGSVLITDMPRWFRQLFYDEGWGWGGDWFSKKDAMHYSEFPNEGGDGRLYVGTIIPAPVPTPVPIPVPAPKRIPEEDDMLDRFDRRPSAFGDFEFVYDYPHATENGTVSFGVLYQTAIVVRAPHGPEHWQAMIFFGNGAEPVAIVDGEGHRSYLVNVYASGLVSVVSNNELDPRYLEHREVAP